ncbi:MAG: TraB/GumN family protein [Paracoccaceae bacterium]|nr:TraB/GumN family protein [Paracoccaceae bacterium]
MIKRFMWIIMGILCPLSMLHAACQGVDLRAQLTASERQTLEFFQRNTPYPSGNHWLAVKGSHRINVIGTVHIGDPRLDPVLSKIKPILAAADRIYLEMTPHEEIQLQKAISERPELIFITTGPTLIDLLPAEEWRQLAKAAEARNIPRFMAAKFQPWYLSMLLSIPPCAMNALTQGNKGLDHRIMGFAVEHEILLTALEPYDTIFLFFASEPLNAQIQMMRAGLLLDTDSVDRLATLLNSYFDQYHASAWYLSKLHAKRVNSLTGSEIDASFERMQQTLLNRRNVAWLLKIQQFSNETAVVAVGAAHLHGSQGVLQLLENAGYQLTQQPF